MGLNESTLAALSNPYGTSIGSPNKKSDALSRSCGGSATAGRRATYEDLESQAADMNIIN